MPDSDFTPAHPGDPLAITADTYNELRSMLAWWRQATASGKIARPLAAPRACVVLAYNSSGEFAFPNSFVEITDRLATVLETEFVKPTGKAGAYHGILLQPTPAGGLGVVAIGGGPYPLQLDDSLTAGSPDAYPVLVGSWLGPQKDAWTAMMPHQDESGAWIVPLTGLVQATTPPDEDGICNVIFPGTTDAGYAFHVLDEYGVETGQIQPITDMGADGGGGGMGTDFLPGVSIWQRAWGPVGPMYVIQRVTGIIVGTGVIGGQTVVTNCAPTYVWEVHDGAGLFCFRVSPE